MSQRFLDALRSGRVLLMDGAMGTELQRAGLRPGECGEAWNLTQPERVRAIHQAYVDAGAEVLLTNTFLADPESLERHGLEEQAESIGRSGVSLARDVAGPGRWVLASVGSSGFVDDWDALPRYLSAFAAADGVLVETCSDLDSLRQVRQSLAIGGMMLPVLTSPTYLRQRDGFVRTINGESPDELARQVSSYRGVRALGVNCGRDIGMDEIVEIVRRYRDHTDLPLFARPNAGTPTRVGDRWVYPQTPEMMAERLPELLEAGVSMVGGCCGTTPAHIAAFRPVVDAWNAGRH